MISSALALIALVGGGQSDPTRTSRDAFTSCLRAYVDRSVQDRASPADFTSAYPQQCTAQEAAYRAAVIRREESLRATRANAEEAAALEVEDYRTSFRELFEMSVEQTAELQRQVDEQAAAQSQQQAEAVQPASDQAPATEQPQQQPPTG